MLRADDRGIGLRWRSQQQTRSRIFAVTRRLMAEGGSRGTQLRTIASECGVSAQTIYNVIGGRSDLLRDASEDWVAQLVADARAESEQGGSAACAFEMVERFWATALQWPRYVLSALQEYAERTEGGGRPYVPAARQALADELSRMRARGLLRPQADSVALADQLTMLTYGIIRGRLFALRGIDQYRRDFVNGPAMLLLGAATPDEAGRIEQKIDRILA